LRPIDRRVPPVAQGTHLLGPAAALVGIEGGDGGKILLGVSDQLDIRAEADFALVIVDEA
jgi:hypothetical protein